MLDNAGKLAGRYARRCRWISYDDLKHTALCAMLDAAERYDETREDAAPFGAYTYIAGRYAVQRAVMEGASPVSCLRDARRLLDTKPQSITRTLPDGSEDESVWVSASNRYGVEWTHRAELAACVRSRLVDLFGESGAEFALLALSREFMPAEIAEHNDVDVYDVYEVIAQIRSVMRADDVLFDLWRNE